jgi:hypothetical protein
VEKEPRNIFEGSKAIYEIIAEIQDLTHRAESHLQQGVQPVKKTIIKRFPIVFLLLVTAGFAAVTYGLEHFVKEHELLSQHPYAVFWVGVAILIFTGAAYKR